MKHRVSRSYEAWHIKSGRYLTAEIGGVDLRVPIGHPYAAGNFAGQQPLRNRPLELLGRAFADAYPGASILDIGANVGDTAVMLGSASTELILVEPDLCYSRLLELNRGSLPPVRRIERAVVATRPLLGTLTRRHGTAKIAETTVGPLIPTKTLSEVCDPDTKLVKIDTDGYDMEILAGAIDFLGERAPLLYFELECRERDTLNATLAVVDQLGAVGYEFFAVWDDAGLLILGDCGAGEVVQLAESLCHGTRHSGQRTTVWGYDVLAVTAKDRPLLRRVVTGYRDLQWTV